MSLPHLPHRLTLLSALVLAKAAETFLKPVPKSAAKPELPILEWAPAAGTPPPQPPRGQIRRLTTELPQHLRANRRSILTATGMAGCVVVCRLAGWLQPLEWTAYDQLFRLRSLEPPDSRVVIVGIGEADLKTIGAWPIPDATMAQLIQKLKAANPRAIGMDIYRDLPVGPGDRQALDQIFQTTPNLVGIEQIADGANPGVAPNPRLQQRGQVGFNNTMVDADGNVRRGLLYWTVDKKQHESFALKLARLYLQHEGIQPKAAAHSTDLQLGPAVFQRFAPNDGSYVQADAAGYQFLANLRGPAQRFPIVPMGEVLAGQVPAEVFRDRIVLIGSTAGSLKDVFSTAYSTEGLKSTSPLPITGVELQANFISQILSAALDGRGLVQVWPKPLEWAWIWVWAGVGAVVCQRWRSPLKSAGRLLLASTGLAGICYGGLVLATVWIPFVPAALAMVGAAAIITAHIVQQQEEMKRSKEFLGTVIDTIPDPIYVKDEQHRWIILNEAYCKFSGYSHAELLENSDAQIFPPQEAAVFFARDQFVFDYARPQESEEDFTDKAGVRHRIETKRSLHHDGAGNVFLVGVMRDITERKRLEEELRQTTEDLRRSNAELERSASHLSHLAHHDNLTGLPNRKLFYERLAQALEWAEGHHTLVGLMFLDLDGFKQINDTLGHDVGDLLLQAVGKRLTGCLRGTDTVSRLGGDEFTVILPSIATAEVAATVAEKILMNLAQPFILKEHTIAITTSIGISLYPLHGQSLDTVIKGADLAMYQSKKLGKNRAMFWQPG